LLLGSSSGTTKTTDILASSSSSPPPKSVRTRHRTALRRRCCGGGGGGAKNREGFPRGNHANDASAGLVRSIRPTSTLAGATKTNNLESKGITCASY
jgi:hypothetical protein